MRQKTEDVIHQNETEILHAVQFKWGDGNDFVTHIEYRCEHARSHSNSDSLEEDEN